MIITVKMSQNEVKEQDQFCKEFNIPEQKNEFNGGKWGTAKMTKEEIVIDINQNLIIGISKIVRAHRTAIFGLSNMVKGVVQMYTSLTDSISKEVKDLYKNL